MSLSSFGNVLNKNNQSSMMFAAAEMEMELMTALFNSMLSSCHKKCISPKYNDGELNKGEAVCVDRCISKYTQVSMTVGQKMQQVQQPA